jgi:pilus assembly protein CpaE
MLLTALAGEADTLAGFAAGADDYVTKPFNPRELAARVQALLARGSAGSAPAARPQGQLIAVAGTKGGCGRTTVAVNVALALNAAARSGRSGPGQGAVVLLDGHLTQGDVDVHLDLRSTTTMRELVPYAGRLDVAAVERTLVLHTSGLKVLLRPRGLGQAELITTSLWQEILQISTAIGEQVVVDLGPGVDDERSLAAWEHASAILLVVTPEISAVRDGRQLLENAERLGIERSRIQIILNRSHNHANLSAKDVAGALGVEQRSLLELPDVGAAAVGRVNRGTPVVLAEPGSALARGLEHLALSLTVRA